MSVAKDIGVAGFEDEGPFVRLGKYLAISFAIIIAILPPIGYFYMGLERESGVISAEISFKAKHVSNLISGNPSMWEFESLRIQKLIEGSANDEIISTSQVLDMTGEIVAQYPNELPKFFWPVVVERRQLYDFGTIVGALEVTHSLEHLYKKSLIIAGISVLASLLLYWALRVIPLRLVQRAWDQVKFLANHDVLTGLANRSTVLAKLESILHPDDGGRKPVAIYAIDLDRFKHVNDVLGHAAGDKLLIEVVERIKSCLRSHDLLARTGGDEFVVIQCGMADKKTAALIASKIISTVSATYTVDGQTAHVGASIGIEMYDGDAQACESELLIRADLALYKSKNEGRGTYSFFEESMDAEARERRYIEDELRIAIDDQLLELHYQPQIELANQKITAVEALLRWNHPERGNIVPAKVIPIAEATGLMRPLSNWLLMTACSDAMRWSPLRVAVNLSPSLFLQNGLVEMVRDALAHSGLPPEKLELEITEDILIADSEKTLEILLQLKKLGVSIAMDDFGTGYSSLSYLGKYPFDKLKIDQSFIKDINVSEEANALVRAMVGMGQALNLQVNAEGVETQEQALMLENEGCDEVQGFLYAKPMSKADITNLLQKMHAIDSPEQNDVTALLANAG
ncbi:MAG: EAL domain-containing protein [Rhizobiales bacterium]|nr:EAL domain-containing protein [Hyphomicrobiales bacterium]